ncbi:dipeptide/oligopeptide/nickel ABC transporter permease/ATP-binding protein [Phytoactinopolyspora limicola]|uniref:dipeptide/oligopeptide/nickel ABC transporter permease/ATP-binding protein n=1 Tax=Phytoactinopolyspora limicola TaxID=2715536 RepID=UPI001408924B|nr:dipeptide/oligopeptide/nickel ABC transporter permease/ATP-binding protein [Phytoactinopolyspora limicola]
MTDPVAVAPGGAPAAAADRAGSRQWRMVLGRLARQPVTLCCLLYLAVVGLAAVAPGWLAPHDPWEVDLPNRLAGPGGEHWLGTDELGRDQFSRLVFGAQVAIRASFQSVTLALLVGIPVGLFIGYLGGWWDRVTMRLIDIVAAIPTLLFAFAIIALLGRGLTNAMLAISMVFAINFARITRGGVLVEREQPYVDAGRVLGLSRRRMMFGQILPNVAAPLVVQASIFLGIALLFEAMLSFLGLGVQTGQVSWGQMLDDARVFSAEQPLLPVFPGVAITLTVLMFNLLGDGLRDALGRQGSAGPPWGRDGRGSRTRWWRRGAGRSGEPAGPSEPDDDGDQAGRAQAEPADQRVGAWTTGGVRSLLEVRDLRVAFPAGSQGLMTVVDGVSFDIGDGEIFGLVGESGCGKTQTSLAIAGLVPVPGQISGGTVRLAGRELTGLSDREMETVRGPDVGMIFQDPLAALSPVHPVRRQLTEPLRRHLGLSRAAAADRAAELLDLVGVPDARRRLDDYPFQFSGGMAQRVVIATALACEPKLLIADEPTTALDVTIQSQVLDVLLDLRDRFEMSIMMITHDLGVVADVCDRVAVMYAGQIVETAPVEQLFTTPRHPYTADLLRATPHPDQPGDRLPSIPGTVPSPDSWPAGCRFQPRCSYAVEACGEQAVPLVDGIRCLRHQDVADMLSAGVYR